MTVGELREAIANLPDDTPVLYDGFGLEAIIEASVAKVRHISDIDEFYQSDPKGDTTLVLC